MYSKSLEKDGKLTPQVVCFISLEHFQVKSTLPIYVLQSAQGHLSVAQSFSFSLNIPSGFAFLMLLGINLNILGASEDMLSVPKYTNGFSVFVVLGHFLNCMVFVSKKVCFTSLAPKSFFFSYKSLSQRFVDFLVNYHGFVPVSESLYFTVSYQKREMFHLYR